MGEIIYFSIQLTFIIVEIYLMIRMHKTKNDTSMEVNINIYNLMLIGTCLLYFMMRTLIG